VARIRTIKPEFFLHDRLAELSPLHRLLFVGLWTQADRDGRLKDRPRRIKVAVLPYDDADVDAMLDDLHRGGFLVRYAVDGDQFIEITGFSKHQSVNVKEPKSTIPPPPSTPEHVPARVEHHAGTVPAPDEHVGKGREGKGKDLSSSGDDVSAAEFGPDELAEVWNETAPPECPRVRELSEKRRARARQRLRENPEPEFWRAAIETMHHRPFLRGRGPRGWRADFDWLLQPDSATRVLEGCYADEAPEAVPRKPEDDGYRYFGGEP